MSPPHTDMDRIRSLLEQLGFDFVPRINGQTT
jgi:hypothetical protein